MNAMTMGSLFLLTVVVSLAASTHVAFAAEHPSLVVVPADGSGVPGCEETPMKCNLPNIAIIDEGNTVTFQNTDTVGHTFTSGTTADGPDGFFDSGLLQPGNSYKVEGLAVGDYAYYCMVHPWMASEIIVLERGTTHNMELTPEGFVLIEGKPDATGMLSDGTRVNIWAGQPPSEGHPFRFQVSFNTEPVVYELIVKQNDMVLLDEPDHEYHSADLHSEATDPLPSSDPVDITIVFNGHGTVDDPDNRTGPIGEEVMFANVVPEFGTIAMIILGVAIVSTIAVTARSKVIPRL